MKLALLTIALFTLGSQAFACYDSNDNRLCTGDRVIPEEYSIGYAEIKAINSNTGKATVKGNNSTNYHRYDVQDLGITQGCFSGLCVDDKIIPDAYSRGYATVKAVNSYSRKYTVKGNSSTNYHRYSRQKISFTKGCIEGVCVGDKVFPDAYSRGYAIVKAINPTTRKFTVKGNNTTNYHRYDFDELALIEECLDYNKSERYSYNFN